MSKRDKVIVGISINEGKIHLYNKNKVVLGTMTLMIYTDFFQYMSKYVMNLYAKILTNKSLNGGK